ncbi:hypothetical protein [Nocardiopsis ansamitocini]|uniref:Adenylate kinase n=1 Tax=Nocardiopsis ansamitocini TaxID=1670832 RepID=A0A9W6P8L1_9ACTN|nr:hypothetical protein [Nocardiopsis ansamitocini]GLU48997.1 adenylate kinase [Nocardiopsis ansamitocini]
MERTGDEGRAVRLSTADAGFAAALAMRAQRAPARAGAARVVAIEGRSGAGKSFVAALLGSHLGWPVLHLDDLYPGWTGLAATEALVRRWVVDPLVGGADPYWRRYDWERGEHTEWVRTPVSDGLVVEGCGSGAQGLRPFLAALIWVEAPASLRTRRLDARSDAADYAPHRSMWAAQEDLFYAEHRCNDHADTIVDNPSGPPRGANSRHTFQR